MIKISGNNKNIKIDTFPITFITSNNLLFSTTTSFFISSFESSFFSDFLVFFSFLTSSFSVFLILFLNIANPTKIHIAKYKIQTSNPQTTFKTTSSGKKAISKITCPNLSKAQKGIAKIAQITNTIIALIIISQISSNVILSCFLTSSTNFLVKSDIFFAPFLTTFSKP